MIRSVSKLLFAVLFGVLAFGAPAMAQDYSSQPAPQPAAPATSVNPAPAATGYGFEDSLPSAVSTTNAAASSTDAAPQAVKLAHTGGNYLLPVSAALVLLGFGGLLLTGFRRPE